MKLKLVSEYYHQMLKIAICLQSTIIVAIHQSIEIPALSTQQDNNYQVLKTSTRILNCFEVGVSKINERVGSC